MWRSPRLGPNVPSQHTKSIVMDAERINLIGNTLQDLGLRVNELRGYL